MNAEPVVETPDLAKRAQEIAKRVWEHRDNEGRPDEVERAAELGIAEGFKRGVGLMLLGSGLGMGLSLLVGEPLQLMPTMSVVITGIVCWSVMVR